MRIDREIDGLVGPVQTVQISLAEISKPHDRHEKIQQSQIIIYDAVGRKIEESLSSTDGASVKTLFSYDAEGCLAEKREYDAGDRLFRRWVYTYDKESKLIEESLYQDDDSLVGKLVYIYDANGRSFESISEGFFTNHKTLRSYDNKGNKTELGTYICLTSHSTKLNCNVEGNPTEAAFYAADGSLLRKLVVTYDAENKPVEITDHINNTLLFGESIGENNKSIMVARKLIYFYDAHGRLAGKTEHTTDRTLINKKVYIYNFNNHISEEVEFNGNNVHKAKRAYHREFDSYGNWIKEIMLAWSIESGNLEPSMVTYRTISYY